MHNSSCKLHTILGRQLLLRVVTNNRLGYGSVDDEEGGLDDVQKYRGISLDFKYCTVVYFLPPLLHYLHACTIMSSGSSGKAGAVRFLGRCLTKSFLVDSSGVAVKSVFLLFSC